MNETEDVINDKPSNQPTTSSLPNTPIVMKVDSGSVFMDRLPQKEMKTHWAKTGVSVRKQKCGGKLILDCEKLGVVLIKWENKDALTKNNLIRILKTTPPTPWRVKWFHGDDGIKYAVKVLDESQYAAEQTARNRHRKMLKYGFATQNEWLS